MANGHDLVRVALGGNDKTFFETIGIHNQRMVAHGLERVGNILEDRSAVMVDLRGFAVHAAGGTDDFSAENLSNTLMAQANTQYRYLAGPVGNNIITVASFVGSAGAGGEDQMGGMIRKQGIGGNGIVTEDLDSGITAQDGYRLEKVVGKRVVIVNYDYTLHREYYKSYNS